MGRGGKWHLFHFTFPVAKPPKGLTNHLVVNSVIIKLPFSWMIPRKFLFQQRAATFYPHLLKSEGSEPSRLNKPPKPTTRHSHPRPTEGGGCGNPSFPGGGGEPCPPHERGFPVTGGWGVLEPAPPVPVRSPPSRSAPPRPGSERSPPSGGWRPAGPLLHLSAGPH